MGNEMTWRKAIEKVLSKASGAVHYKDIADKIIAERLRWNVGATPAATQLVSHYGAQEGGRALPVAEGW